MSRAPMQTPISCVACGGAFELSEDAEVIMREECKLCEGTGLVSKAAAGRWQRARMARLRITKQFFKLSVVTRQLCRILESRRTKSDLDLAARGRALLEETEPPSGTPEKAMLTDRHLDFHQQVAAKIRGNR